MKRKSSYTSQDTSAEQSGSSNSSSTKSLIIGTQDFDEILEKDALLIDKTLFIKEFIKDGVKVTVILRPRRFGKSLNLSMLKSFLSLGQDASNFSQYRIGKETKVVHDHCGKYPVVMLDLKDCKGNIWQDMYEKLWNCILTAYEPHSNDLSQCPMCPVDFTSVDAPEKRMENTLSWLITSLWKKFKKRVIVLVDEYDSPLNHAFRQGYYNEASEFFGTFYSQALKGNSALEKACLMGIVEVRGAGILSGLNNISVYSIGDEEFSSHFGFTESEISEFLGNGESMGEVVAWYDGYRSGKESVINPWSFVNWVKRRKFNSYWVSTSNIETIGTVLTPHIGSAMEEIIAILFDNQKFQVPKLAPQVNYSDSKWETSSILHFLVHTGYLTYEANADGLGGLVWIPNREVRIHWKEQVIKLLKSTLNPQFQERLSSAVQSVPFDINTLEKVMRDMLQYCSFHDLTLENSYHVFYFGSLFTILDNGQTTIVSSNREAGHGRYDICINLADLKRVIIIEFKKSKSKKAMAGDAKAAVLQVQEKNYSSGFRGCEFIIVGISFFGKLMSSPEYESIKI